VLRRPSAPTNATLTDIVEACCIAGDCVDGPRAEHTVTVVAMDTLVSATVVV
jgi:hypothetical protein